MPFQLPTTPAEWAALDELVHNRHDASVSRGAHIIIWLVTITGPIPGILYLISAVKRCRTNGWWMVRIDEGGYLYPHNRVMLTFWVVAFTIVNLALSISVLFDCRSFLHPRTLILQTISFYTLSCLGWAKVWSLFCAMPPSRYRLAQVKQKNSSGHQQSIKRPIPVCLFNPLIIIAHLASWSSLPWLLVISKAAYVALSSWDQYQSSYANMVDPSSTQLVKFQNQLQALLSLEQMLHSLETTRGPLKKIYICGLVTTTAQLIATIWCSYRILGALYFQAKVLRQAASREINLEIKPAHVDFGLCPSPESISTSPTQPVAAPPAYAASFYAGSLFQTVFAHRWKDFLPGPDRETKIPAAQLWNRGQSQKTPDQMARDRVKDMSGFYRKLRRYAMNTFWHIFLTAVVKLSHIVMSSLLILGVFDQMSVMNYEVTLFLWLNITWNCGVGVILGVISCIVVYTPTPTFPREPDVWEGDLVEDFP
ncbi:hypothetical protein Pst134EA_011094 [Puccinia striiformis f. sp. tritici]|uniref:Uncharacterized protein n=1 Tax=Puccinia striiformis f. sp. tritici PST-78 TaxID=1165861 RepID=A0A0L0USF6_9BASI|nr:hypothetical protein Pst134EA_011094 [Puccinia striiformis f. sp. tritici]KAH9467449.1 hypothetical protein Pst134EA_011094 [Puccinia striiformis f. sp. tritici]KNE89861.1 hypothetical protein PSTG_16685 [Puccinia striiformis f. sp. tritici PST-78]